MAKFITTTRISSFVDSIKEFIFGENNSRLDALLDYFYSLRQEKRVKIILYMVVSVFFFLIVTIVIYFVSLSYLQKRIDNAVSHQKELNNMKSSYLAVNDKFQQITSILKKENQYSSLISTLDQKNKELVVESSQLPEKPVLIDLQGADPLYGQFQKVKIAYKLPNISLKKIIDYVSAIQQLPNKFKVSKIEIQQKLGTKLYFEVNLELEAYVPTQKSQE